MSLSVGECDGVGAVGAVEAFTLVIASLVVSLDILLSCSNSWRFLDGSYFSFGYFDAFNR